MSGSSAVLSVYLSTSGLNILEITGVFAMRLVSIFSSLSILILSFWQLVSSGKGGSGGGKGGGGGMEIRGDTLSTLRIAARLCLGPHDDWIVKKVFDCYDEAPGKSLFIMCQKKIFEVLIDTEAHVNKVCLRTYRLPFYGVCVMKAFRNAGLNMNKALTKLNKCQGKVLGL